MTGQRGEQLKLKWSWIDSFILIQYMAGAVLLIPGTQPVRFVIRGLPYVMSLFMWVLLHRKTSRRDWPAGFTLLLFALLWLILELLHPLTQFRAGLAQVALQASIVAPVFWMGRLINRPEKLHRALILIFICNALSAGAGLLQVYFPDRFMPKEFNKVAEGRNEERDRTYVSFNGRKVVRPPGLTDIPGGGANAAMVTALLGISLSARKAQKVLIRLLFAACAAGGMAVVYLSQVRVLLMVTLIAVLALIILGTRMRGVLSSTWIALATATIVAGTFVHAVSIGGKSVAAKFLFITDQGLFESYEQSRGMFLREMFDELVFEYPLGAGLGRWGMMNTYFNDDNNRDSAPLWVEIQPTGWLLDGGLILWFLYGGAIIASLWHTLKFATTKNQPQFSFLASNVFALNLATVAVSSTGVPFNTQMGIGFWMLAAGLYGAKKGLPKRTSGLLTVTKVVRVRESSLDVDFRSANCPAATGDSAASSWDPR